MKTQHREKHKLVRRQFPLTSDQLELLLAFDTSGGLLQLSEAMAKDPSVISRNLQRLAEILPVIEKLHGRWKITSLGYSLNSLSIKYLDELSAAIKNHKTSETSPLIPCFSRQAVLLVINAQNALLNPELGNRSNEEAEENILRILKRFRERNQTVVHVKHISKNPKSSFFIESSGTQFISALSPRSSELVVEKTKSSSFSDTKLQAVLNEMSAETLILTGFTANDCIDATARHSSELGFATYVVGDATSTFDISGHDGKLYKADRVHSLTLANLNALYAQVIDTEYLLQE